MRRIAHLDIDAFFASCEEACNPSLKKVPLIITGRWERGVVTAANAIAKTRHGIVTGMSGIEAHRRCPDAVIMIGNTDKYIDFSKRFNKALRDFTPHLEPYSIDEVFLDLTGIPGCEDLYEFGRKVKARVSEVVNLPSTIGFGPNRLIAKMACKQGKPDGVVVLDDGSYRDLYWPRSCATLWGIGRQGARNLGKLGIETVGDLARYPVGVLESVFGVRGRWYHDMAWGRDDSEVGLHNDKPNESYGHSHILRRNTRKPAVIRAILFQLCDRTTSRMRADGVSGRTLHVALEGGRFGDWHGRQTTLPKATASDLEVFRAARDIYNSLLPSTGEARPEIRRLAIRITNLERKACETQQELFPEPEARENRALFRVLDDIRNRYGDTGLLRASRLEEHRDMKAIHFQTSRRFHSKEPDNK